MSEFAAREAMSRMNMREVAVAAHYSAIASDLRNMASADPEKAEKAAMARRTEMCAAFGLNGPQQDKPFAFAGGIAIIPVSGTLINRFSYSWGFVTGYNFIRSQVNAALADDDVTGIVLDVNSYGGEAAGCFELAADIRAARAEKPILAVVDSNAYSAGYAVASAASKIVVTPSGGAGSIGVVAMHVDMSKMLEDYGVKVTFIFESDHKVDGNPYEPLPDSVKASIQAGIHKSYEAFVALVAENMGIDAQKVRDTKSRMYRAEEALALGLIHAIATPIEAVRAFMGELSGSNLQLRNEGTEMSTTQTEPGADQQAAAQAAAAQQAASDARVAERARVSGIMGCEEAKGRTALANHLAMETDMTVDQAKSLLAKAPVEKADSAPANPFAAAMNTSTHPNVGAEGGEGDPGATKDSDSLAAQILGAQEKATGIKLVSGK